MSRFLYWRDPLFVICSVFYCLNRWAIKPHVHSPFFRGQFNDLLLIPCAPPLVLWLQRLLRVRENDGPPTFSEIGFHIVIWSVIFEVIGPRVMRVTGDPRDILAYSVGGMLSGIWWARGAWRIQTVP